MSESIIDRLERILLWADERGLDETECRAMRDAVREIERLQAEVSHGDGLQERMADILTRTVNALRGKPPENGLHSWHDLPERVERLQAELDKAERTAS